MEKEKNCADGNLTNPVFCANTVVVFLLLLFCSLFFKRERKGGKI